MKTKNVNDWHFVEHLSTDIKTMAMAKLVANQPANHQYTEYKVCNSASGRQLNENG